MKDPMKVLWSLKFIILSLIFYLIVFIYYKTNYNPDVKHTLRKEVILYSLLLLICPILVAISCLIWLDIYC